MKFLEKLFGKNKKEEAQNMNSSNVSSTTKDNDINQNNNDDLQPITFNQNINTEINQINSMQQPLGFTPTAPLNNSKPPLNMVSQIEPSVTEEQSTIPVPQEVENILINNQTNYEQQANSLNSNQEITQPVQELNVLPNIGNTIQSHEENQINNQVITTAEPTSIQPNPTKPMNNNQPELNVIPGMTPSLTEQPMVNNLMNNQNNQFQNPVLSNQLQEQIPSIQMVNVIPTMGPTPEPTTINQNPTNNQNM